MKSMQRWAKLKVLYIHLRGTMHVKYANMKCFLETVKYSVKSSGPNREPWGTPLVTVHQLEKE